MEKLEKVKSNNRIPLMIGIVLIIAGIFFIVKDIMFILNADKIKAEVVECEVDFGSDSDSSKSVRVYVNYAYNGKEYSRVHVRQSSEKEYSEGALIDIYVNRDDPSEVTNYSVNWGGIALIGMAVFLLILVFYPTKAKKRAKEIRINLQKDGIEITAAVDKVIQNTEIVQNGKSPYYIKCVYIEPATQTQYMYTSECVWNDLRHFFKEGDAISVTVLPDNYNIYYVDIEKAFNSKRVVDYT